MTPQGDHSPEFAVVVEGTGDVSRLVGSPGEDAYFGHLVALDYSLGAASVTARTDMRLVTFTSRDFLDAVAHHPLERSQRWSSQGH